VVLGVLVALAMVVVMQWYSVWFCE